jgi:aryl-alcohol dehydrogenase-like predicted oxidoreductase
MLSRPFGRLGWRVSEIGYGLWGMGGWSGSNDEESSAALDRAIALGCNFFDTALAYGNGRSEQILGRVLARHRDKTLYVATKVPPKNGRWPALKSYALDEVFPADHVRRATEASLTHLGLASVDLQQFHVWTDAWANDDRWQRVVSDLKREGLIRGFGISLNRWEPSNVLAALRTGLVDSVQVVYNVFDQDPEDELLPMCRELNVAVISRVPFDEGSLAGALHPGQTWPDGDWRNLYFSPDKLAETLRRVALIAEDVPAGMTMAELALRHILSQPAVSTVIPGMRRTGHVEANLGVSGREPLPAPLLTRLRRHRWRRDYTVV